VRVFLDVGAHEGQTLEAVVGRFDMIYAFEPMPLQYEILVGRFGEDPNIMLCNYGLAAKTGSRYLYGNNEAMDSSFYSDKVGVDESVATLCLFQRASTWFETYIETEDDVVMKLNCEGAEVEIMNDLLDSGEIVKVGHVMIDFDVRKVPSQQASEKELMMRMAREGFDRFSLCEDVMWGRTHRDRIENWLRLKGLG